MRVKSMTTRPSSGLPVARSFPSSKLLELLGQLEDAGDLHRAGVPLIERAFHVGGVDALLVGRQLELVAEHEQLLHGEEGIHRGASVSPLAPRSGAASSGGSPSVRNECAKCRAMKSTWPVLPSTIRRVSHTGMFCCGSTSISAGST